MRAGQPAPPDVDVDVDVDVDLDVDVDAVVDGDGDGDVIAPNVDASAMPRLVAVAAAANDQARSHL